MPEAADIDVLVLRRTIAAPPQRVFRAFTDGPMLARWMSPVGHAEVDVEPRIGGTLRVTMVGEGRRIEHVGEFLELDPPHRLAFTWQSEYTGARPTRVTVDLAAVTGGTDLTLRHELLPEAARASHAGGWSSMLDRLTELATDVAEEVQRGA